MYGMSYGGYPYPQNASYGAYGYTTPVYQQPQQVQQSVNTNKMYTTGIEDVRCRQLPANSDYIFLDNDKPLVYRKTTDATGKMNIEVFKIVPYEEEAKPQPADIDLSGYVSVEDFRRLERQFEELKESFAKSTSKKTTT